VKLNKLGFVGRGKSRHRPRNDATLYGGPYPFIQTADIMASDLYINHYTQTYSEFGLAQSKLWDEGTLCMTIAGENTGEVAILKFKACFPDSIIGFVADQTKADVCFVKYYFDTMKRQIKNISRGATQDNLSLDKLLSLDVLAPPLPVQERILTSSPPTTS
jgi:type I restriction enzyme S subunit